MKTWIWILILVVVVLAVYLYRKNSTKNTPAAAIGLASCIKASGAKFYGASWCPHCNSQKEMFGDDKKKLPYIECSDASHSLRQECASLGITGFPTWIFANGKMVSGELSIEQLKQITGC